MADAVNGQDDALKPWIGIPKVHSPVLWMEWSVYVCVDVPDELLPAAHQAAAWRRSSAVSARQMGDPSY